MNANEKVRALQEMKGWRMPPGKGDAYNAALDAAIALLATPPESPNEKLRAPLVLGDFLPAKFHYNPLHSRLEDIAPYLRDALSVIATPPESAQYRDGYWYKPCGCECNLSSCSKCASPEPPAPAADDKVPGCADCAYNGRYLCDEHGPKPAAAYPTEGDREVLNYLMQQFDAESWQCPKCGHEEDCATMDSADYLRCYLKAKPAAQEGERLAQPVGEVDEAVSRVVGDMRVNLEAAPDVPFAPKQVAWWLSELESALTAARLPAGVGVVDGGRSAFQMVAEQEERLHIASSEEAGNG